MDQRKLETLCTQNFANNIHELSTLFSTNTRKYLYNNIEPDLQNTVCLFLNISNKNNNNNNKQLNRDMYGT